MKLKIIFVSIIFVSFNLQASEEELAEIEAKWREIPLEQPLKRIALTQQSLAIKTTLEIQQYKKLKKTDTNTAFTYINQRSLWSIPCCLCIIGIAAYEQRPLSFLSGIFAGICLYFNYTKYSTSVDAQTTRSTYSNAIEKLLKNKLIYEENSKIASEQSSNMA